MPDRIDWEAISSPPAHVLTINDITAQLRYLETEPSHVALAVLVTHNETHATWYQQFDLPVAMVPVLAALFAAITDDLHGDQRP